MPTKTNQLLNLTNIGMCYSGVSRIQDISEYQAISEFFIIGYQQIQHAVHKIIGFLSHHSL